MLQALRMNYWTENRVAVEITTLHRRLFKLTTIKVKRFSRIYYSGTQLVFEENNTLNCRRS